MYTIIPASNRYLSDYGSIKSHFLFSFSDYYDPNNMSWGDIRVFNDDFVASGAGFPTHPHKNFEIMTIMLSGTITHQDSLGNKEKVHKNEIQVTNTGRGISHSEFNEDAEDILLYQLWFTPKKLVAEPSYYTAKYTEADYTNTLYTLASGIEESSNKLISEITVQRGKFEKGQSMDITSSPYVLVYVTSGRVQYGENILETKYQLRTQGESNIQLEFLEETEILVVKSL